MATMSTPVNKTATENHCHDNNVHICKHNGNNNCCHDNNIHPCKHIGNGIHSFKNLYSASSSPLLLRGATDSSKVKKNSFKTMIECVQKRPRRRNSRGRPFQTDRPLTQKAQTCMRVVRANGTERTSFPAECRE